MTILVTGGAGYIGSHTCIELIKDKHNVIIIDNFYNSSPDVIDKIEKITGTRPKLYPISLLDKKNVKKVFEENKIDAVIHFAGLKAVGESVEKPLMYYRENIYGTIVLLEEMKEHEVKKIVFSSSATVYGIENNPPYTEDMKTDAINPYGYTKVMIERIITDVCNSDSQWKAALLRYFNPIGAHESGLIGDNPNGIPNNLMPYIQKVAVGEQKMLKVFGNDYPTPDGTGYRDYLHVVDLAIGHIKALESIDKFDGAVPINLGTGKATSVLELIHAFEKASGVKIPYEIVERRTGDLAVCYADTKKAETLLEWKTKFSIEDMCRDSWNFINNNK
ncbi:MAG: UDP-glucose 4-epimerase GalE [Clostridiales bacterium]|nr:UDP-glucose 4-epimerase GalE [Clostridiales bacterium]